MPVGEEAASVEESEESDVLAAAEASADISESVEDDSENEGSEQPEEAEQPEEVDYDSMKVPELKELLKEAGKPVSGKKADLIARLKE